MKNHLIKIHNHADVSSLPLLQAINFAERDDSDQNELESHQTASEILVVSRLEDQTIANE